MSGVYIRVVRNGLPMNVLAEDLTEEEWQTLMRERPFEGWRWCRSLVARLAERMRAPAKMPGLTAPVWADFDAAMLDGGD